MGNNKSKNIIIGVLAIINIVLVTIVILFATGKINFKNKIENIDESNAENIINNEQKLNSNKKIYADVINEYKQVITEGYNENNKYKYINENAINKSLEIEYSFYDINNDGSDEMLINRSTIDIFSYDGTTVLRLFNKDAGCLATGRCSIDLYKDGTIYFRGSRGFASNSIDFYSINKNIATLNTINSYQLTYDDNGSLTVYDGKTFDYTNNKGVKLDYNSVTEILNANIHNTKEVDLNNLMWNKFK